MRFTRKGIALLCLAAAVPLSGCNFITKLKARDSLNKGVRAFTEQKYDQAAEVFNESIKLDPEFQVARMYLATTYTSQFVPGSTDPKSNEMAEKAIATFQEVLANYPSDNSDDAKNARLSIASLFYQLKKYDESKQWCRELQKVDPDNAEALYRIAV